MQPESSRLEQLPAELLLAIFEYLPRQTLQHLSLASRLTYNQASAILWRNLVLVDRDHIHGDDVSQGLLSQDSVHTELIGDSIFVIDDHDDTPIIKKLLLLASNPTLASKVRTVTHRCHLPTPAIFAELPFMSFSDTSLSSDWRTLGLLHLAIQNMVNVHTLRIIFGHYNICKALLTGFLDSTRPRNTSIQKLWLESCEIQFDLLASASLSQDSSDSVSHYACLDTSGLESIRIRRLRLEPSHVLGDSDYQLAFAREGITVALQNGRGSIYETTVRDTTQEVLFGSGSGAQHGPPGRESQAALYFDEQIFNKLPDVDLFLNSKKVKLELVSLRSRRLLKMRALCGQSRNLITIMSQPSQFLTSLNLDWLILATNTRTADDFPVQSEFFQTLSTLRFKNLKAFQLRNTVCDSTKVPEHLYLLHPTSSTFMLSPDRSRKTTYQIDFLSFLEAHPNLECLAWPIDRFFSLDQVMGDERRRVVEVISRLGATLKTLRLDSYFDHRGESQTDESDSGYGGRIKLRRRHFIQEFAPYMRRLKTLKMEGGIPRDEKREILRAIHKCPLEKLVLIGVSFPLGNTWGENGIDIHNLQHAGYLSHSRLEAEDHDSIMTSMRLEPALPPVDFRFWPTYGWPPGPPLLYSIASLFSSTVRELKFCGYNGAVILHSPDTLKKGITPGILHHLRYFHNLDSIVMSFFMLNQVNDHYVIESWIQDRNLEQSEIQQMLTPRSMCVQTPEPRPNHLVSISSGDPEPQDAMYRRLYSGSALARQIDDTLRPYLSPVALAKKGGINIRASFCVGTDCGDVFDLELGLDKDGIVWFKTPREEGEPERWFGKLDSREYF